LSSAFADAVLEAFEAVLVVEAVEALPDVLLFVPVLLPPQAVSIVTADAKAIKPAINLCDFYFNISSSEKIFFSLQSLVKYYFTSCHHGIINLDRCQLLYLGK
jgi:hypothetical protein